MEISDLREMVEMDPDDAVMRYVLGTRLLEDDAQGSLDEAVENFEAVIRNDPKHVASYLALGRAYLRLGHEDRARETLEKGVSVAETLQHGEGRDLIPEFEELIESI